MSIRPLLGCSVLLFSSSWHISILADPPSLHGFVNLLLQQPFLVQLIGICDSLIPILKHPYLEPLGHPQYYTRKTRASQLWVKEGSDAVSAIGKKNSH